MKRVLHASDACIAAQFQPALALDFAQHRELDSAAILNGTGLVSLQAPASDHRMSPQQYLQLLTNIAGAARSADTSFMLGQQMLPGHFGPLSHLLAHAANLREALACLARYPMHLSPLLAPRLLIENKLAVLYWSDSFGAGPWRGFLVEMHMTAVSAMCRWLSGARLPWQFCFNRTRPRHLEQHEVHLGDALRFDCHLDALLIDATWLDQPWPRANAAAVIVAARSIESSLAQQRSLTDALYDYLLDHIRSAPTLEESASAFGVSAATLKRQLARHGTHFQAELDQVRTHVALQLFHGGLHDNDDVAQHLGFHDANNFRRSFKRWTGITPLLLRQSLHAYRLQSPGTSAII